MTSILKEHIKSGRFHHGYLLAGDFDISREMASEAAGVILRISTEVGLRLETHPDFSHQVFDLFGIKDSQELKRRAAIKSFSGNKVFVIEINTFSIESANALLKTLEEPYEGTYFFIIVPSAEDILPTLRSRLVIIDNRKIAFELDDEKKEFYKKFLKSLPSKRIEMVKKFQEEKEEAIAFLNELEVILRNSGNSVSTWKLSFQVSFQVIQQCRDFLYQKGSSPRLVLEHLALALPHM